jgi:hypothetical protein
LSNLTPVACLHTVRTHISRTTGKKGKAAAAVEEDLDAILAEVGAARPSGAVATSTEKAVDDMTEQEVQAAIAAPGTSKTRKQKLKQRLKSLQARPRRRWLQAFVLCVPADIRLCLHVASRSL